jgi:hypothetical protein
LPKDKILDFSNPFSLFHWQFECPLFSSGLKFSTDSGRIFLNSLVIEVWSFLQVKIKFSKIIAVLVD